MINGLRVTHASRETRKSRIATEKYLELEKLLRTEVDKKLIEMYERRMRSLLKQM